MERLLDRQDTYKGNPWQPWTQNLYVYTHNNPVNFVDPTGHADAPGAIDARTKANESTPSDAFCSSQDCKEAQAAMEEDESKAALVYSSCARGIMPDASDPIDVCMAAYSAMEHHGYQLSTPDESYSWLRPVQLASADPVPASVLRQWARDQGYKFLGRQGGIEMWGVDGQDGWRLKLKLPSLNAPLSGFDRYSARVGPGGPYINPVTGQTGSRSEHGHGELEWDEPFDTDDP